MARYTGPKNRLSRREGIDLFGRGNKLRRATVPPGQHGPRGTKRLSDYGTQLREKQKTKRMYGIMERQFRKYFEKASQFRGSTGERLLQLLETRLDNIVYRLGFTPTRAMARQLVGHGHVLVNNQKVNIPSYQVQPDQVITLKLVKIQPENSEITIPAWLQRQGPAGRILKIPARAEIDSPVNEQLIVEYYSR